MGTFSIPGCPLFFTEYLSKPTVTMALQSNKNGTCVTNLTCSMEQGGEDVTYSWKVLEQAANVSHNGSILPISWTLGEVDMTFICIARNPISFNSSRPIFVRKLCEGDCLSSLSEASGPRNYNLFSSWSPRGTGII